ncbi:hypothetical protein AD944_00980 [Acetobacter tropicalis]|nr:hypothetical protein AD944_00980 [Acetobacter tropicalis]
MVFRKSSIRRAHQATHRQVKPGRAILALIVAIGFKFPNACFGLVEQDLSHDSIDTSKILPSFFVGKRAFITQTTENKTIFYIFCFLSILSKPCDGANCPWNKKKPIGEAALGESLQFSDKLNGDGKRG